MFKPRSLSQFLDMDFDEVIDVRSPSEFEEDHVFGAINLPVLDCGERSRVGLIYTQESRFRAKKIGAALVARNIAGHLEGALADRPGSYRPLVYCWRGGERSGAMAEILRRVGWRVEVLEGGYRTYRRLVTRLLYEEEFHARTFLVAGNTGTAKTALLGQLEEAGAQVIDLEDLADHRGSLFGATGDSQPSQKAFESALAEKIVSLDHLRPVFLEAESSKIGDLLVPPSVWTAMQAAQRIELSAPVELRMRHILAEFAGLVDDRERLNQAIRGLGTYHSREQISEWLRLSSGGRHDQLVRELIERHYDPRYRKHRARFGVRPTHEFALTRMDGNELAELARQIVSETVPDGQSVN